MEMLTGRVPWSRPESQSAPGKGGGYESTMMLALPPRDTAWAQVFIRRETGAMIRQTNLAGGIDIRSKLKE